MSKLRRSLSSKLSLRILLMAIPIFILCVGTLFIKSLYLIRLEAAESANSTLRRTVMNVRAYMGSVETSTEANAWCAPSRIAWCTRTAISSAAP